MAEQNKPPHARTNARLLELIRNSEPEDNGSDSFNPWAMAFHDLRCESTQGLAPKVVASIHEAWQRQNKIFQEAERVWAGPLLHRPLLQRMAASFCLSVKTDIESGDGFAVMEALAQCVAHGLASPNWLSVAFIERYQRVISGERKGWQVHTQIGASSFRVDLGVVHPDFAGRYLAGVECDGATYHRSATARDRDKLREQVLRGLGWEIVRIWSTDWWVNPGGTLERVHAALTELLEKDRERRANEAEVPPDEATPSLQAISEADAAITRAASLQPSAGDIHADTDEPAEAVYARPASMPSTLGHGEANTQRDRHFQASQPTDAVPPGAISADLFYESSYDTVLQPMVEWVVQREGPVLDAVLARRIARAHGFQRTGSRIQERVEQIARLLFNTTDDVEGTFYWPRGVDTRAEFAFRWPSGEDSVRGVEEICEPELVSLARWVLGMGKTGEEALIAMAREIGLMKLRAASRGKLEKALRANH